MDLVPKLSNHDCYIPGFNREDVLSLENPFKSGKMVKLCTSLYEDYKKALDDRDVDLI